MIKLLLLTICVLTILLSGCKKDKEEPLNIAVCVTNKNATSQQLNVPCGQINFNYASTGEVIFWIEYHDPLYYNETSCIATNEENEMGTGSKKIKEGEYEWSAAGCTAYWGSTGTCTLTKNQTTNIIIH